MDAKLIPAHVLFSRWFIRIRWMSIGILILATFIVRNLFEVSIREIPIYVLSGILILLNFGHLFVLRRIQRADDSLIVDRIRLSIHVQILTDLVILTCILHFSGGIENPMVILYFLHLIIASSIFSARQTFWHAGFALLLAALLVLLESYSIIPHYHLEGFFHPDLYQNPLFIYGAGFIFMFTSVLVVSLSQMIISRSVRIEETYVKVNRELEKKDKLQHQYVLRVTHDIKGHLAAITSCLSVLRAKIIGDLTQDQEEFVNRAYERTELLTKFVKDLLNLTRMRLSQEHDFTEFALPEIVLHAVSTAQIQAREKGIDLSVFIDPSVAKIYGNPITVEELYTNLLLNAVKYTPDGGKVSLTVRNRPDHVISQVSDSGIGIPKEDIPKIFNEFFQAGNVSKEIKSGSGLGLSIVKQIVDNHHGRIWLDSEEGVWTKFYFTLPKKDPVHALPSSENS